MLWDTSLNLFQGALDECECREEVLSVSKMLLSENKMEILLWYYRTGNKVFLLHNNRNAMNLDVAEIVCSNILALLFQTEKRNECASKDKCPQLH